MFKKLKFKELSSTSKMLIKQEKAYGFSLIELAISVVIIGVIAGAILSGYTMIEAGKRARMIRNINTYELAINAFRVKYNCLPGDCVNATEFLGANPNCPYLPGTGTETCNGDGNRLFARPESLFWSWQQLGATGMIEGEYTGVPGPVAIDDAVLGENVPELIDKVGCGLVSFASAEWGGWYFPHPRQNVLYCGIDSATSWTTIPVEMCPRFALIDYKIDDGKPGLGIIRINSTSGCVTSVDPQLANYTVSGEGNAVLLRMLGNP